MPKSRDTYGYGFTKSGQIFHKSIKRDDSESWAINLCALLDKIEMSADDESEVRRLCRMRFQIAEDHGLTVEFGEPASGIVQ